MGVRASLPKMVMLGLIMFGEGDGGCKVLLPLGVVTVSVGVDGSLLSAVTPPPTSSGSAYGVREMP